MTAALDDRTVAYVVTAQPIFEDLRQVASQIAGLLVLSATGSKTAAPDHPMLASASHVFAQTADAIDRVAPSASGRATLHHDSLVHARDALRLALTAAHAWPLDIDAVVIPLQRAYAHLRDAAGGLPGFPMVSFEQACCGVSPKL